MNAKLICTAPLGSWEVCLRYHDPLVFHSFIQYMYWSFIKDKYYLHLLFSCSRPLQWQILLWYSCFSTEKLQDGHCCSPRQQNLMSWAHLATQVGTRAQRNTQCGSPEGHWVTRFARGSNFNFKMRLHSSYLILTNFVRRLQIRSSWHVHLWC